jgi:hypothetical protein
VIEVERADSDKHQVAEAQQSAVHVDVQDDFAKQVKLSLSGQLGAALG